MMTKHQKFGAAILCSVFALAAGGCGNHTAQQPSSDQDISGQVEPPGLVMKMSGREAFQAPALQSYAGHHVSLTYNQVSMPTTTCHGASYVVTRATDLDTGATLNGGKPFVMCAVN